MLLVPRVLQQLKVKKEKWVLQDLVGLLVIRVQQEIKEIKVHLRQLQVIRVRREVARAKKEAETLRSIMKGYIGTIDSLNQLNTALLDENLAMKAQMEAVSQENADLVERQENMEDMLEAGQTLQVAEFLPTGVRVLSSGRQRDTDRADRCNSLRVCFTILENRIAPVGDKTLHLRITDPTGRVLPDESGGTELSASRTIDYARERLDACIFYNGADGNATLGLDAGTYLVEILEGTEVIGTTDLVLR